MTVNGRSTRIDLPVCSALGTTALRSLTASPERASGVEFAIYFVAVQAGGVERILCRHHPMPNGLCGGCLARPTTYPCQAARIAELARRCIECGTPPTLADVVRQLSRRASRE